MQKYYITIAILAVIALLIGILRSVGTSDSATVSDMYEAVPLNPTAVIDIKNLSQLIKAEKQLPIANGLQAVPALQTAMRFLHKIDTLRYASSELNRQEHLLFSLHTIGKNDLGYIVYYPLATEKAYSIQLNYLKKVLESKATIRESQYDNVIIYQFKTKKQETYLAYRGGILFYSDNRVLLEEALRQVVAQHKLTHQPDIANLLHSAGKSSMINVLFRHDKLPSYLRDIIPYHLTAISHSTNKSPYTHWDINLKDNAVQCSGFTSTDMTAHAYLFKKQKPISYSLSAACPAQITELNWIGLSDISTYYNDYKQFLTQTKNSTHLNALLSIEDNNHINFKEDLPNLIDHQFATVRLAMSSVYADYAVFKIKSNKTSEAMLNNWADRTGTQPKLTTVANEYDFTVYNFPFSLPYLLFNYVVPINPNLKYTTLYKNYLIAAESLSALRYYLDLILASKTLDKDALYTETTDAIPSSTNYLSFFKPNSIFKDKSRKLPATLIATDSIPNFPAIAYQLSNIDKNLYTYARLQFQTPNTRTYNVSEPIWELRIDTTLNTPAYIVRNHRNNEKEIILQDKKNQLYLISSKGEKLWKIPIRESILSPIYQIDAYKNDKLQYLFSTENYIYLIDRLGNLVPNFPIKLPAPAIQPVSVFDYDKNREYRILIPLSNKTILAYDRKGQKVDGWRFDSFVGSLRSPIYHFQHNGKDYITFAEDNNLRFLDRQGRDRIYQKDLFPLPNVVSIAQSADKIYISDKNGTIQQISLPSLYSDPIRLKSYSQNHIYKKTDNYILISDDGSTDVYDQYGTRLYNLSSTNVQAYNYPKQGTLVGALYPQKQEFILYDHKGKKLPAFPIEAAALPTIGTLRNKNIVNLITINKHHILSLYEL